MERDASTVPAITSEDIDTIRGALMTLKPLAKEESLLWGPLLKAAIKNQKIVTADELYRPSDEQTADEKILRGAFRETCKKTSERLNVKLAPLLGYGYRVEVIRDKDEYRLEIKKQRPELDSDKCFDHNFKWKSKGVDQRSLKVWVPVHRNGSEISIKYSPTDKLWTPPSGYAGYDAFRAGVWDPFAKRNNKGKTSQGWCVQRFLPTLGRHGGPAIELMIAPVSFQDIVGTTLHLGEWTLPDPGADKGENTVLAWLKNQAHENHGVSHATGLTHFFPAANPLSVDVNVITSDKFFVFRSYKTRGSALYPEKYPEKTRWEPGISGFVDSMEDVYRNNFNVPDPSETVFRIGCQLLGLPIYPARVCWLGVGFGLDHGRVSLYGEITIGQSRSELETLCKHYEIEIKCVPAESWEIVKHLRPETGYSDPRPHFEALLALSLARRNKAKVETWTKPSDELTALLKKGETKGDSTESQLIK